MAWGSKVSAAQLTSITTEQFFSFGGSTKITLNPGEEAHLQIAADFPSSPTDHLDIAVYPTLDDSSEVWSIQPLLTARIQNSPDPNSFPLIVGGVYAFRVGVARSGTTDTITSADASYRKTGINL